MAAAVLPASTVCNTVPDCQTITYTVRPDWITLRILTPDPGEPNQVLDLVAATLRDSFEILPGPHKIREHNTVYDWMAVSAKGIRGYWHNPGNGLKSLAKVSSLRLEFPGLVCGSVNAVDLRDLMSLLAGDSQAVCTRFDIALDDYTKSLWAWDDLEAAARDRNYSGPQQRQKIDNFDGGVTYYFGTRKSEAFYRFYDKNSESGGEVDTNRMELELKRSKAHQAFLAYLQPPAGSEDEAAQILAEFVMGNIDFIDRSSGETHLDRCPRLPWWQAMKDAIAQGVKLAPIRAVPTIEKSLEWLEKKVFPTIVALERLLGSQAQALWDGFRAWGREHQNHRHENLITAARLEGWGCA